MKVKVTDSCLGSDTYECKLSWPDETEGRAHEVRPDGKTSRFMKLDYRMDMSKKEPIPFLGKLIFCNQITAFICDDCFEERHERCYGTKVEVKRTYEDVFPCEPKIVSDTP